MLKASPAQRKQLGEKVVSFVSSYGPTSVDAVLFVDGDGRFGFNAGPDAPLGCRRMMNRAGIDRLMTLHGYLLVDFTQPDKLEAFAELVCQEAWLR